MSAVASARPPCCCSRSCSSALPAPSRRRSEHHRRQHDQRAEQPRPAHRHRRCVAEGSPADLRQLHGARRSPAGRAEAGASRSSIPIRSPTSLTLRQGVRFHDGHELTADDVVFTFGSSSIRRSCRRARARYRELQSVTARDPYTVVFTLKQPFASFPHQPDDADRAERARAPTCASTRSAPGRIGSSATPWTTGWNWSRTRLLGGAPKNSGLVLKIVPDDVMRGLELQKGTMDIVVNDLAPDIVHQMRARSGAADRRGARRRLPVHRAEPAGLAC